MDDRAAELDDLLERPRQVVDREVRQRGAVAGAGPALVQAEPRRLRGVRLQARSLPGAALGERDPEQLLPEAPRALEVVGRKLDQHAEIVTSSACTMSSARTRR